MTIAEWLATRTPIPPPELLDRVRSLLGDAADDDASSAPERCLATAERLVAELLAAGRVQREAATDLLAADALVTYAFEAAAERDTADLRAQAHDAMVRLARLGRVGVPSETPVHGARDR